MKALKKFSIVLLFSVSMQVFAAEYKVAWSHYTGWEPWAFAEKSGILDKWAEKYKIKIKIDLINDYIESINLYTAGKYDACTMTNMDALTIPAVGGIDSTALIVGDFSNGNDGIVMRNGESVKDLKGKKVKLVELSVSHYLLSRALTLNGLKEKDLTVMNTSDADIGSVYLTDPTAVAVTWNPILMNIMKDEKTKLIFDSSKIPGEIMDLMVVKTNAPESLKKALVGAWFETMTIMSETYKNRTDAVNYMAKNAGSSVEDFEAQLKTTKMFYKAEDATKFVNSDEPKKTMEFVRTFSFNKGLFGSGAANKDFVGIQFADGSILGNEKNVKFRFTAEYMDMAAKGKL